MKTKQCSLYTKTVSVCLALCFLAMPLAEVKAGNPPIKEQVGECIFAIVIVGLGVGFVIGIVHVAGSLPVPAQEPPEPPPFIPPIIILFHLKKQDLGSGPPPRMTCFPGQSGLTLYNISQYGWTDTNGWPYYAYFKTTLQGSTNFTSWTESATVRGYVSPKMIAMVWSTNGVDFLTNAMTVTASGSTNTTTLPFISPHGLSQTYRLVGTP